ncbi:MAG: aldo/keto reductase [Deltaproteobacteria bacterium]|nr:aldo/keto reductase [Deltaproteobacteria bacterium]
MEYTTLKNSDLRVSRICLGTWLFGGRRWGKVDTDESLATIRYALDSGINFYDTADAYGEGIAENLLGRVLAAERKNVVLATKAGVVWRNDGTRYIDLSASHIHEAVHKSLQRLKTDYIDLYQLHEMDPNTPIEETGVVLLKLIEEGLVRYIGVSDFDCPSLERLRAIVPVLTVQSEYNLLKRESEADMLLHCLENGLPVLAYSPLEHGLLTGKFVTTSVFSEDDNRFHDEEFQGERFLRNLERIEKLKVLSRNLGKSPSQVAIRWLLDSNGIDVVICGARRPEQLIENVGAAGWKLSEESFRFLSVVFRL